MAPILVLLVPPVKGTAPVNCTEAASVELGLSLSLAEAEDEDEDEAPKAAAVTVNGDEEAAGTITTEEGWRAALAAGVTPPLDNGVAVTLE